MELIRLQCPACGAELPPQTLEHEVECQYCNSRFATLNARRATTMAGVVLEGERLAERIAAAEAAPEEPRIELTEPDDEPEPTATSKRSGELASVFGTLGGLLKLALIAGIALIVVLVLISEGVVALTDIPLLRDIPALRKAVDGVIDDHFDPHGGPPILTEIRGQPAVVARIRRPGSDLLFVAAYSVPDGEQLWSLGPIDHQGGDKSSEVRFAVAGEFVVYSDANKKLHIRSLASGGALREVSSGRRVVELCGLPLAREDGDPSVLVVRKGGSLRRLDPSTGKLTGSKGGLSGCEEHQRRDLDASLVAASGYRDRLDDFEPIRVHEHGERALALGHAQLEPKLPEVIAVKRPKSRVTLSNPMWRANPAGERGADAVAPLSARVSMIAGELVIVDWREVDGPTHLTGLRIEDGTIAWDTTLDPSGGDPRLYGDERYLLVARDLRIEILDPASGEALGTITPPS